MPINKYAKKELKKSVIYIAALTLFSIIFYLFGYDVDDLESNWAIFLYFVLLNVCAIPTTTAIIKFLNKRNRKK